MISHRKSAVFLWNKSEVRGTQLRVEFYSGVADEVMTAGVVSQGSCVGSMLPGTLNGWKAGGIQGGPSWLKSLTSPSTPAIKVRESVHALCPHQTVPHTTISSGRLL